MQLSDQTKKDWWLLRICAGGVRAIRAAGSKLTPLVSHQNAAEYAAYLQRGRCPDAVSNLVRYYSGLMTVRRPTVEAGKFEQEFGVCGETIYEFHREVCEEIALMGGCVMSLVWGSDNQPRVSMIPFEKITELMVMSISGAKELVEFEYVTVVARRSGDTWTELDERRRFWIGEDGFCYHSVNGQDRGVLTLNGYKFKFLPFKVVNFDAMKFGFGRSPVLQVAELMVAFFQNSCCHRNALHIVGAPMPYFIGFDVSQDDYSVFGEAALENALNSTDLQYFKNANRTSETSAGVKRLPFAIGPNSAMQTGNTDAKLGYMELEGPGLEALRSEEHDIILEMAAYGFRVTQGEGEAAKTATQVVDESLMNKTLIGKANATVSSAFRDVLRWMFEVSGVQEEPEFVAHTEGVHPPLETNLMNSLLMAKGEVLSGRSIYEWLGRHGLVRPGASWEDERAEMEVETGP